MSIVWVVSFVSRYNRGRIVSYALALQRAWAEQSSFPLVSIA